MKKILFYILIFTTITGGLFGLFGGVNNNEKESSIFGVDRVYAKTCIKNIIGDDYFEGPNTKEVGESESCGEGYIEQSKLSGDSSLNGDSSLQENYGIECSIFDLNIGDCFAVTSYYIYRPTSFVLTGSASIFNKMLAFSVSKNIIDQDFVKTTWGATRGFANMLFILVLVAISISIILDMGQFKSKELILNVIVIALAVNFSLFAARAVIDVGNITALGFYNSIKTNNDDMSNEMTGGSGTKDVSGSLVGAFDPTLIVSKESFESWRKDSDSASAQLAIVFLMAAGINLYTAYIFFMAGFLFVVRVAWLWILMSLAPLAFLAFVIPQLRDKWTKWWKKLIDSSFCITVFMFLVWVTLIIVKSSFVSNITTSAKSSPAGSLVDFLVIIFMQYMIVIVLLRTSLSETKKMCDDGGIGDKVFGMAKGAALLGAGVVTGGGAMLARAGAGKFAASRIASLEAKGASTTRFGRMQLKALKGVEDYKFGKKESYAGQRKRVNEEHTKTIHKFKDIPEVKDSKGNVITPGKTKAEQQDAYIKSIERQSLISTMMGNRSGENKAVKDFRAAGKLESEIKDLKEKDLIKAKADLDKVKDSLEKGKKAVTPLTTAALDVLRDNVARKEAIVQDLNDKIKSKNEALKDLKNPKT